MSDRIKRGHIDAVLLTLIVIILIFGVVMVFSASYYASIGSEGDAYKFLWKQVGFAGSGFIIMLIFSRIDYHVWQKLSLPIMIISMAMLLLVFTKLGLNINGASRWIAIPLWGDKRITIMPGEIAKGALIIFVSSYFASGRKRARRLKGLLPVILYTVTVSAMIIKQPNLSTAITVFAISVGIAFCAGMQWRYIAVLLASIPIGIMFVKNFLEEYQYKRLITFLDPFSDPSGDGFQVIQSLLAIASGGLFGVGLGRSVQKNLYLPEPQNDFITAIIGEELGFIGIAFMMMLFVLIVWKMFCIGLNSKDELGMLLSSGVAIMIGLQAALNIAVATSSMPATGIALPFVSYGGNSMWILTALVGIVLNVSRQSAHKFTDGNVRIESRNPKNKRAVEEVL